LAKNRQPDDPVENQVDCGWLQSPRLRLADPNRHSLISGSARLRQRVPFGRVQNRFAA
jgi:hypothetical protein